METTIQKSNNLAEIELRYKTKVKPSEMPKISDSRDAYNILRPLYGEYDIERIEEAIVLVLNRANKVLGWVKIGVGGLTGVVMDVKVIMQIALNSNAASIVVAHNHPSQQLKPSVQDIELTRKIKEAARLFDISLLDHLILTAEGYTSMADEGIVL
jgi:DNA repair protein RadC